MLSFTVFTVLLLSVASAKDGFRRHLEEAAEEDFSFLSGYTMKFEECFRANGQDLAYFSFCPAESKCESGCEGGTEYVSDLLVFVDAFTEAQLGAREYACEMARENCNADDDASCYAAAGLNYCEDDEEEFDLQEYMECANFDDDYFVGPYCKEGMIYLGYFADEDCTQLADEGTFFNTYGYDLEYSEESGVSILDNSCANCREHGAQQDQNDGDQADEDDVLEQCEELYAEAQSWSDVAEQYDGKVSDVRATKNTTQIVLGVIVAILASVILCGCVWYYMGTTNDKKKALLSVE